MQRYGLILALFGAFFTPSAAQAASCRIPGGRTIEANRVALLITLPAFDGSRPLYACIRRSGRKVLLDYGYSDPRLSGRWVAWQRPGRPGRWRIAVHDLRTGKERLVDGHVAAHSLRVTSRGSIVWAQRLEQGAQTPLFANEVEAGGRLLDGGDVDAASVGLRGRRVVWTRDGSRHSTLVR